MNSEINRESLRELLWNISQLPPVKKVPKPIEITPDEAEMLDLLCERKDVYANEAAEFVGWSSKTAGGVLRRLRTRGLATEFHQSEKALRRWKVTPLGRKVASSPQSWAMEG